MRHTVLAPSRQSPPHDPNPRQCPCLPQDRHRTQDCRRIDHVKCHVNRENESKWKSTSRCSLSASLSALFSAMAFGRPCRVIAARMHAEKKDSEDYEFQKSEGHRGDDGSPGRFDCRVWYADLLDFVVGSRCADLDGWRSIPDREIWSRPPRQPAHCFHSTGQRSCGLTPANSSQPLAMTAWRVHW
jgi:hypothetical protein